MPINAVKYDNASKTLLLNYDQWYSLRKVANDIFIDDAVVPTFDGSGNITSITHNNEINVGKLTGNPTAKKQQLIDWANQNIFMEIVLLADLPVDEPTKTVDPDRPNFYWSDGDGVKNPSGLYRTAVSVKVTNFDETLLANDDPSGITISRVK